MEWTVSGFGSESILAIPIAFIYLPVLQAMLTGDRDNCDLLSSLSLSLSFIVLLGDIPTPLSPASDARDDFLTEMYVNRSSFGTSIELESTKRSM